MTGDCVVALALAAACTLAWGQGGVGLPEGGIQAERARLESMRLQITTDLDAEAATCLSRFAVTDCQNAVGVRRRQLLEDVKRQENSLNATERQQKAAEQLLRDREKAADNAQRQRDARQNAERALQGDRQKAQEEKQRAHKEQARPAADKAASSKSGAVLDPQTVEKNRQAFLDKQKALEKRRQERAQRLVDHGKGAAPLPLPP